MTPQAYYDRSVQQASSAAAAGYRKRKKGSKTISIKGLIPSKGERLDLLNDDDLRKTYDKEDFEKQSRTLSFMCMSTQPQQVQENGQQVGPITSLTFLIMLKTTRTKPIFEEGLNHYPGRTQADLKELCSGSTTYNVDTA